MFLQNLFVVFAPAVTQESPGLLATSGLGILAHPVHSFVLPRTSFNLILLSQYIVQDGLSPIASSSP